MSREALEQIVDRWVTDANFREDLKRDVTGTISRAGFELDADELAVVQSIDFSLTDQELQSRISKGH